MQRSTVTAKPAHPGPPERVRSGRAERVAESTHLRLHRSPRWSAARASRFRSPRFRTSLRILSSRSCRFVLVSPVLSECCSQCELFRLRPGMGGRRTTDVRRASEVAGQEERKRAKKTPRRNGASAKPRSGSAACATPAHADRREAEAQQGEHARLRDRGRLLCADPEIEGHRRVPELRRTETDAIALRAREAAGNGTERPQTGCADLERVRDAEEIEALRQAAGREHEDVVAH